MTAPLHPRVPHRINWKKTLWFIQRFRRPLNLTGRYYDKARFMLLTTVELLERAGIEYRIHAGTLLGIARDQDLIPWDYDIDLILPVRYLEPLRGMLGEFKRAGLRPSKRGYALPSDDVAWRRGAQRSYKIRNHKFHMMGLGIGRGRIVIDIFIAYPHDGHYWWSALGSVRRVPCEYLDSYDTLTFAGRPIKAPHDHEAFLELLFGDWRRPDPDFDSSVQDGTILRPLSPR